MLHEIQPGDVVIVTVPKDTESGVPSVVEVRAKLLPLFAGETDGVILIGGTETSVHVIRAKKAEDKPKPDWPAWRDVRVEKPPVGRNILYYNKDGVVCMYYCVSHRDAKDPSFTHWMPLPEGPKS